MIPGSGTLIENRLDQAKELMPQGVAYGGKILRIDYDPAMVLAEDLAVRKPEELRPYVEVATRAAELWARSVSDLQWESKIAELRGADDVFVDATYLASVPRAR